MPNQDSNAQSGKQTTVPLDGGLHISTGADDWHVTQNLPKNAKIFLDISNNGIVGDMRLRTGEQGNYKSYDLGGNQTN